MRIVAVVARFADRCVIPEVRTALLRMTADARLVHPVADLQHADACGPVGIVASGAVHLPLAHWHVARTLQLRHLGLVAGGARFDDRRRFELRSLGLWAMNGMAGHAREIARVVHPTFPVGVAGAIMTGDANLSGFSRRHRRRKPNFRLIAARFGMGAPGTVTGLAGTALLRRRRAGILHFPVQRLMQLLALRLVTGCAGVVADVRARLLRWRWGRTRRRAGTGCGEADYHRPGEHKRGHQQACRKTVTAWIHDLQLP